MPRTVVFIAGTGTDVGKTHVTVAFVLAAKAFASVLALKPVASGVEAGGGADHAALEAAVGAAVPPPLFAFGPPLSPHLAARQAGTTIAPGAIVDAVRDATRDADVVFVESAGGLYSPLSETETNADLARALETALGREVVHVLVAPDRIGVLHDVGATVRAARADGIAFAAVVLSAPAVRDASTGTNAGELVRLGLARQVLEIPRGAPGDAATQRAAAEALARVGLAPLGSGRRT